MSILNSFLNRRAILRRAGALAIAGAALASTSLTPATSLADEARKIAVSFPNASVIGAVITSLDAAKEKGAEMGYSVFVDDPGTDLNKQINTIKTWIQQKVDVIVVNALQPDAFESVAKQAREAGIVWITYGQKIENQDATVGYAQYPDGRQLGEYAGQWVTDTLDGKAKVIILGYEKGVWGQQRGAGIKDGLLDKAPNVEIVAEQDAISPTDGLNVTRSLLQAHPDANVILGVEDPATEGAYKAWIAAGKDPADPTGFIGGMDGTVPALKLLKKGGNVYRASMAIPLVEVGYAIVTTADSILNGEETGDVIVPLELVTEMSPKADEYLAQQGAD
ncbi:sugar ABC transporter substrate-binding protein [Pseudooceanicola algae]|uniref:Ribose import binding protein RbsB n=1 Tax=Pseudooceanicola algae TaxID=1537215 RepID=A0A418SLE9_9RHOB|nr:sugar ABC transporter substrate-binding protein [Pseudooceanicola algae]QPM90561.1 Ribose import binding protein RbsB [Pseudooceanicola algae]